ncbi:MAG: hypothetical protein Q8P07_04640, partial [bacterium]|nr:hypothetical protein [bacterium]
AFCASVKSFEFFFGRENQSCSKNFLVHAPGLEPGTFRTRLIGFCNGGVCLKKSEPILRRTLKTNADSAGRNI